MKPDTRWFALALLVGIIIGLAYGFIAGDFVDRSRNEAMPVIIEYFDLRESAYDVHSDTTFISPRQPRPDPEQGE
jgi:hypothetical protein